MPKTKHLKKKFMNIENTKSAIPDVTAFGKAKHPYTLEKVGMQNMEIPVVLQGDINKPTMQLLAHVDAMVNLNSTTTKGIHMSRLYLLVYSYFQQHQRGNAALEVGNLESLMEMLISSQKGLSDVALLNLRFSFMLTHKALLSQNEGSRFYPVEVGLKKTLGEPLQIKISLTLTYSSTCPCSAALSRQLIRNRIHKEFSEENIETAKLLNWLEEDESALAATPHSQRSFAKIQFSFASNPKQINFAEIINTLESILPTPVQAAVKREDEQEFARLNAENLIFCEDIARILKDHMETSGNYTDYAIKVSHEESLHAHDAVAETFSKNNV